MISQVIFTLVFVIAIVIFTIHARQIYRNICLGKAIDRTDLTADRWKNMFLVAFGQKKMFKNPLVAVLHLFVYLGFIIINIEMLEIIIDGIFGTHRVFSFMGYIYNILIFSFEILSLLVIIGCSVFLIRRNIMKVKRLSSIDLKSWPKTDANIILIVEILLMSAFLTMNAADYRLQQLNHNGYPIAGSFPISQFLIPILPDSVSSLQFIERLCWWFHIIGVLAFLNYLPISKHLHIILAFPNTYFANLNPQGKFANMPTVTAEVKSILDPTLPPPVASDTSRFGAKDIQDLTWKSLMDAYTCTECGRCSAACPANITGKLLSPRKIMMDTRDRVEEVGKNIRKNGEFIDDNRSLLDTYITREEIWACTSCNACVEECPVNINPLEIILNLRQYAVMEESQAPTSINTMFANMENNGAPWKYAQTDRANWINQ